MRIFRRHRQLCPRTHVRSCTMLVILVCSFLDVVYLSSTPARENLAFKKSAWESSSGVKNVVGGAVDGIRHTDVRAINSSCSHTKRNDNPWLVVDLGAMFLIDHVNVLNRGDCCGDRLHNFTIEAGVDYPKNNIFSDFQICWYYPGTASDGELFEFNCRRVVIGRYVKVQIYDVKSILALCEVEVYGVPYEPTTHAGFVRCRCQKKHTRTSVAYAKLEMNIHLRVNRNTTSRYKRRLECQSDTRMSSKRIGIAGTLVLVLTFGVLLVFDILTVLCRPHISLEKNVRKRDSNMKE